MHIGILKNEKMNKIGPGIAKIQRKTSRKAFLPVHFRGHGENIRKATFARDKATATRFGLHLCHPWTDFGHFFNFENPISIFY